MILDDVSITALTFGREYTSAIEAKQVAQQEAERAKFIVEKAKQDKRSAVIKAEGEAKSAKLIGEAIASNPAFITLRRIEAARGDRADHVGEQQPRHAQRGLALAQPRGDRVGRQEVKRFGAGRTERRVPVRESRATRRRVSSRSLSRTDQDRVCRVVYDVIQRDDVIATVPRARVTVETYILAE